MQVRESVVHWRERASGVDVSDFLGQVENRMVSDLALEKGDYSAAKVLTDAGRYLMVSPWSKRIRPRLVHAFALALGLEPMSFVDLAVSVEGIHTASLMHDDVVDAGELRRGQPTVNARWGNMVAILGGDLVLSRSIMALSDYGHKVMSESVRVVEEMTQATMMEVEARGRVDFSREEWKQVARGKTGVLLAFCGRGPAYVAGREELLENLTAFGHHFGMAFQLADDLKDLLSDAGKDRFADIREKNPSYPQVVAREWEPALREKFQVLWSQRTICPEAAEDLGRAVIETGAGEETRRQILRELELAHDSIQPLLREGHGDTLESILKSIVSSV